MEILIVGGIIVALMVYVSTRIKKSAASAYEEEAIDAPRFALVKPEGFLSPVEPSGSHAFEAYSKDFGEGDAEKLRQAEAHVEILVDRPFAEACGAARRSVDRVLSEETAERMFWLRGEKAVDGVETEVYRKIVASGESVFDLEIRVLREKAEEYAARIVKLLESFQVKQG